MSKKLAKSSDAAGHTFAGTIQKPDIFAEFVGYCSMPYADKCDHLGIKKDEKTGRYASQPTLKAFAQKWGVSQDTLTDWKRREDFQSMVFGRQRQWGMERIPDVLAALYKRCLQYGMAYDIEVYMAFFAGWNRNKPLPAEQRPFTMDDIRAIVAPLSREKQAKFYATIADIIGEAEIARSREAVSGDQPVLAAADPRAVRG